MADFMRVAVPDEPLDILFDNVTAVRLFAAMQTQWRTVTLSTMSAARLIRTGLDYGVLDVTARMSGLEPKPTDFIRLQIMEVTAINAWAEEAPRR